MKRLTALLLVASTGWSGTVSAQVVISGRLRGDRLPGGEEQVPYAAIYCFASLTGSGSEPKSFRSWETAPAGWYRLSGPAGTYTLVFSQPAHFMRPIILNNIFMRAGEQLNSLHLSPRLDYAVFEEREWDSPAAHEYDQPFRAGGKSVTQVGFRVASDGVDGAGPGAQNILVSIHRRTDATPDRWPQVGPERLVVGVDSGGAKNYIWSAGWDSGEVPTEPGHVYAVRIRTENPEGRFQPFWLSRPDPSGDCFRVAGDDRGFRKASLWMGVSSDGDGLVIPYNKKVHKKFGPFAGFDRRWSQTYVARGRSLASVILFAAVGGAQPPLSRQRVAVRVREGGPNGPVVGLEKIGIGNGNYTGDASWGVFGTGFAPGEVPLVPGNRYAVEFESLENWETLNSFVNIKGQVSDGRPGFNPYRKEAGDTYEHGTAYRAGREVDLDLDLQLIEYEFAGDEYASEVVDGDKLWNGDMESNPITGNDAAAWRRFSLTPGTLHSFSRERLWEPNHVARVAGGPTDGGYVQRASGLSSNDTYRLTGRVRSSWAVDDQHQCNIGFDRTGQTDDPEARTIEWATLPGVHGVWLDYSSEPIRPADASISVWLRGRATRNDGVPFKADFDDFALHRVRTAPPGR